MRLLIMGPPGAGKGTQASRIATHLGIPTISTGEIFRANITRGTALGLEVKRIIDAGDYVPDDITEAIVAERLSEPDCAGGFLLDGFPRTIHQADALDAMLGDRGLDAVLSLVIDLEPLVARMLRRAEIENRPDDNEATIRHRMEVYTLSTEPLLAHYRAAGILVEVDGDGTIDEVTDRLVRVLHPAKV
ncbi:MAG TPA: adenylate kinase [Propionibacteriaceae bacterium]|nr:adenylate kinase [Propionibacteriaceae bacterium]